MFGQMVSDDGLSDISSDEDLMNEIKEVTYYKYLYITIYQLK